ADAHTSPAQTYSTSKICGFKRLTRARTPCFGYVTTYDFVRPRPPPDIVPSDRDPPRAWGHFQPRAHPAFRRGVAPSVGRRRVVQLGPERDERPHPARRAVPVRER